MEIRHHGVDHPKLKSRFDEQRRVAGRRLELSAAGRGFQGTVKRWNFGGGPASHGQKGWFRRPGGIGACATPGWVVKGKKMAGHMGQASRTVQNLEVIQVREEDNVLLIKGAIPGSKGDYVVIRDAKKRPKAAK